MANSAGVEFSMVHRRDGRMFREPGPFAFARSDLLDGPLLLFVGQAENLAQDAGPGHPQGVQALQLGMDALHIRFPHRTPDRSIAAAVRIVHREQPLLNVVDDIFGAVTPYAQLRRAQV